MHQALCCTLWEHLSIIVLPFVALSVSLLIPKLTETGIIFYPCYSSIWLIANVFETMFVLKKENTCTFNMPNFQILKSQSVDLLIFKKDQMKKNESNRADWHDKDSSTAPNTPKYLIIEGMKRLLEYRKRELKGNSKHARWLWRNPGNYLLWILALTAS